MCCRCLTWSDRLLRMALRFHDRIRWSEKAFSLTALLQKFESRFPIIVLTSSGFHGHNEAEVISAAEIVRIHSPVSQWRVFAFDSRGRIFSLPLTLRQNFETIRQYGQDSKPKRLSEILDDHELPVRVSFAEDSEHFQVGEMKYNNVKLGFLTLYKLYEERFLRLNTIARGVINKQTLLLPVYVPIEVKVAEGLKDGSVEDWDSIMATYDRAVNSAKTSSLGGLDENLVYDPTDGKIINPEASHALHDRPQRALAVDSTSPGKSDSKARRDLLSGKLSAIRIRENQEPEKRDETSYIPDSSAPTSSAEIFQSMPNEKSYKAVERTGLGGDDSHQTRTASGKVDRKSKAVTPRSESPAERRSEKKSRNRKDESMQTKIRSNKAVKDLSGNHGMDAQEDADEQKNVKIGEESGTDLYFQAVRRTNPLERPTAAKRRRAPTGRVSPMEREGSGKMSASADSSGVATEPPTQSSTASAAAAANGDYIAWPIATVPTRQQPSAASVTLTAQTTEATAPRYGAHVEHRNPDALKKNTISGDLSLFEADGSRGQTEAGKKSSLKLDRRRSNRAKRHVSYSDTDTIYPFDSTDDMADDSEVDTTLFRPIGSAAGELFAAGGGGRWDRTHVRHPLRNHRPQRGNLVVNVHRPGGGGGGGLGRRRNTTDVFPAMTPWDRFSHGGGGGGSDSSALAPQPPRFGASFRRSGIDVIPETPEENSAFAAGLANNYSNNRSKEYFEKANLGPFDFDNRRRGANSMISAGGARNDNSLVRPAIRQHRQQQQYTVDSSNPMSFSKAFPAPEYNQATTNNNNSLRRQMLNEAGTQSKRTDVDYIRPNGATSNGHVAWRQEGKTPTMNGTFNNGLLPQPEYRHRIGNIVNRAETQPNFSSKVIRLNETSDGNKWADIEERRDLEANRLVYSGATMRRSKNIGHVPSNVANSLEYMPSAGIVSSVTINGMSPLPARTLNNPVYDVTRNPITTQTMPRNASYNQSLFDSSVMERNRPGKKIIPI